MMKLLDANGADLRHVHGAGAARAGATCRCGTPSPRSHEHLVTGTSHHARQRAQEAFDYVDTATQFALGACPDDRLPDSVTAPAAATRPEDARDRLELHQGRAAAPPAHRARRRTSTRPSPSTPACGSTSSIPSVPLYTVYVIDDGTTCTQIPRRFYAQRERQHDLERRRARRRDGDTRRTWTTPSPPRRPWASTCGRQRRLRGPPDRRRRRRAPHRGRCTSSRRSRGSRSRTTGC